MSTATDPRVSTVKGIPPEVQDGPTPTERTLSDGQKADHWVLSVEERAKGYVRPVRREYRHVGSRPVYPLVDLTDEQRETFGGEFVKYEPYPESEYPAVGRYWTQAELDSGCGQKTTMPQACAETYAREPSFYGSTFCCQCGGYFKVGKDGEFVWLDDGTKVGT